MENKLTEIVFVIDKSGSMQPLIDDTIGGFNGFVEKQKAIEGNAELTVVLFSSDSKTLYSGVDIREVPLMDRETYTVGGMTALLDAVGETIELVQDRHDGLPAAEKPGKVLFVIITDGCENSSRKYSKKQISTMIKHQTGGHGWEFIYLGADMESVNEMKGMGVQTGTAYSAMASTLDAYDCVSKSAASYRVTGSVDAVCFDTLTADLSAKSYTDVDGTVAKTADITVDAVSYGIKS